MKKFFYITIILLAMTFSQMVSATGVKAEVKPKASLTTKERTERASLSIRFKNYTAQTAKQLPKTLEDDFESLAKLKLTEPIDNELVLNALKTLLIIDSEDDFDPSRGIAQTLTESYKKYKQIYNKSFEKLKTDKNKAQIEEIKKMWDNLNQSGNG